MVRQGRYRRHWGTLSMQYIVRVGMRHIERQCDSNFCEASRQPPRVGQMHLLETIRSDRGVLDVVEYEYPRLQKFHNYSWYDTRDNTVRRSPIPLSTPLWPLEYHSSQRATSSDISVLVPTLVHILVNSKKYNSGSSPARTPESSVSGILSISSIHAFDSTPSDWFFSGLLVLSCMRLAFLSRHVLRPMQLGHHFIDSSSCPPSTQNARKRSLGTNVHTPSPSQLFTPQNNTDLSVHTAKIPRKGSVKTPREAMRAFGSPSKKHLSSVQGVRQGNRSGKNKKARQPGGSSFHSSSVLALPRENDPIHDAEYINQVHQKVLLKKAWEQNPKSPLSNLLSQLGGNPAYRHDEVTINGTRGWRQVCCAHSPLSPLISVGRQSRSGWTGRMTFWV